MRPSVRPESECAPPPHQSTLCRQGGWPRDPCALQSACRRAGLYTWACTWAVLACTGYGTRVQRTAQGLPCTPHASLHNRQSMCMRCVRARITVSQVLAVHAVQPRCSRTSPLTQRASASACTRRCTYAWALRTHKDERLCVGRRRKRKNALGVRGLVLKPLQRRTCELDATRALPRDGWCGVVGTGQPANRRRHDETWVRHKVKPPSEQRERSAQIYRSPAHEGACLYAPPRSRDRRL